MIIRAAGAIALCGVVALAGCSSDGSTNAPTSLRAVVVTTTPPQAAPTTPPVTSSPVSSPPATSGSPTPSPSPTGTTKCTDSDLRITSSGGNGASQHDRYVLSFHNVSTSACTLFGYPGVDALAADGHVLAHAARTVSGFMGGSREGTPTVTLPPGGYASATVEFMTSQQGTGDGCHVVAPRFATTAANTKRAVTIDRQLPTCGLQIHPTVPDRSGSVG